MNENKFTEGYIYHEKMRAHAFLDPQQCATYSEALDEIARLTARVRELEDALKRYADHETWFGDSEYSTYRDRLICKRHGWEDAEQALMSEEEEDA